MRAPGAHPHFVVVGDAMVDYTISLSGDPWADEKSTVLASHRDLGGTGANAAVTLCLLGGSVELFAAVSDDAWGAWIAEQLSNTRIGTSRLTYVRGAVPHATIVLLDTGERRVLVDRGVADQSPIPNRADLDAAAAVYVSNPVATLRGLEVPDGTTLVVGVEHQMVEALSSEDLAKASLLITNAAGWPALRSRDVRVPILETRGADGVRIHWDTHAVVDVAADPMETADATGAGDAFAGAFCWYYARPMSVIEAVGRAATVASLAAATAGSHLTRLDPADVERRWSALKSSAVQRRHQG